MLHSLISSIKKQIRTGGKSDLDVEISVEIHYHERPLALHKFDVDM